MTVLISSAFTNQTLPLDILQYHAANKLLTKNHKTKEALKVNGNLMKDLVDPRSNITCLSPDIKDLILPPRSLETFHTIISNDHYHMTCSILYPVNIQLENQSYTLENIYVKPVPCENYKLLIGIDYLKPVGAIIHTTDGSIDFEHPLDKLQINNAKLGSVITDVEFERKIKNVINHLNNKYINNIYQ
ncbi:Aspartic peptidase domain-containing protein [Strongyloides ratti]|uniref:Aspartic peptidase domain-containing protein n=1 Tax=Strongyloides ratti TaxID=34506 RepID=A0A090MT54_STRRB|nr:Aspartic peptidase domain-containing protein [Strongyloides ratti]CEF61503.1 Aspartic peptidase domain-containing protein [Strongyloides ratti]